MTCEECFYWDSSTQLRDADPDTTGQCRKRAPSMDTTYGSPQVAMWPITEDADWCGEFRAKVEQ